MTTAPGAPYRLVLDVQATQNPAHAHRGIGRYVKEHARALMERRCVDALMLNPHLPFPRDVDQDLLCTPLLRWNTMTGLRAVADRAEGPLAYHVMSPFELGAHAEGELPVHVLQPDIPVIVTLYDLIPLVDPHRYAGDPERLRRYRARTKFLASADLVLTISEHTARDAIENLQLDPARVATIGAGVSPFFHPANAEDPPDLVLTENLPLITRPFVLAVAGDEPRKNTERLLEAWATLPSGIRASHQLVLACHLQEAVRTAWLSHGTGLGLGPDDVVVTGWVNDGVLRALYQQARLFVLPSLYEGFGLPAAEAAACGCPAITSATSSLPEVLDWPPSTFDPLDVASIADSVHRALTDEGHREALVARGTDRAGELTWDAVTDRTLKAIAGLPEPTSNRTVLPVRVALVGPMPPVPSGIAYYNAGLAPHLAERCELDIFSPTPRPPEPPAPGVRWFPPAALSRNVSPWSYDAVVYTIGNSDDHHDLFEQAEEFPGVLWMHDVRLPGLYLTYARERMPEESQRDFLLSRLLRQYRRRLPPGIHTDAAALPTDYVAAGLGMSKELVDIHRGVVVSSEVARRLMTLDQQPDARPPKVWVIPHAVPQPLAKSTEPDLSLVVSFGIVAPVKAPALIIRAFAAALTSDLGAAQLVFVGQVSAADRSHLEKVAKTCGVAAHVSFTGLCSRQEYEQWLLRAGCAVQLRLATNGESSGAVHECIANGIPVITNIASAAELPAGAVELVPHDVGVGELAERLARFLTYPDLADRQRRAQEDYAASWGFAAVADRLLEVISELTPSMPGNARRGGQGAQPPS